LGLSDLYYPWGFVLQILALIHFFRRRPEGYWFFAIMFLGALGALIYFVVEVVPDAGLLRASFHRAGRRRRIAELEAIVRENSAIGNVEELADLSFDEGQFAKARELYGQVLASPQVTSVDPYYRRGVSALMLGDAAAAIPDLERVVRSEPKYDIYRAAGLLGQAYAQANMPDKADAQFRAATDASTLSETYFNYASFLAAQLRNDEARDWAERILAKKATMPRFARRQERPWFRKAEALRKKLK
jgi:hypothetical protein